MIAGFIVILPTPLMKSIFISLSYTYTREAHGHLHKNERICERKRKKVCVYAWTLHGYCNNEGFWKLIKSLEEEEEDNTKVNL